MKKGLVGPLVCLIVLLPAGGCRQEKTQTLVFPDANGHLVAGIGAGNQTELTWKSSDIKVTQFWIRFTPADYCIGARDGVIASVSGTATCKVNPKDSDAGAMYQIYSVEPTHETPVGPPPPANYIGPTHCVGC